MMMATRYKRAMAPLDAKARERLWDEGGAAAAIAVDCEGPGELEELVRAFYNDEAANRGEKVKNEEDRPAERWRRALEVELKDAAAAEPSVEWIRAKAEAAVQAAGLEYDKLVRRRLIRRMQDRGLDAGICESRWDNTAGIPAGSHEYIDVIIGKTRYIVEINLGGEFEIARPTADYMEMLSYLPKVFVGRPTTLEAVIRLMCLAVQESIKKAGMHVPPWRQGKYMHEKWFGSYRRQTDTGSMHTVQQRCRINSVCREGATGSSKLAKDMFLRGNVKG